MTTLPTIDLKTASGQQINAAVAEYCARLKPAFLVIKRRLFWRPEDKGYTSRIEEAGRYSEGDARARCAPGEDAVTMEPFPTADYLHSADAVIELLASQGFNWQANHYAGDDFAVSIRPDTMLSDAVGEWYEATADTFTRAACICLLRASGKCQVKE